MFRTVRILSSFRRVIDPPFSEAGCDWLFLAFRRPQYVRRAPAVTVTCDRGNSGLPCGDTLRGVLSHEAWVVQKLSFKANCPTLGFTEAPLMTPKVGELKLLSGSANCG